MATDGVRAHDILLGFAPLSQKGACWFYVWKAYAAAGASTGMGSTPTAYAGWKASLGKHPGDMNPPPGAAIWLGRRYSDGNLNGDVFIAGSQDGQHAATDQPTWGKTGLVSIRARMALTGREYLGWTDHVMDCPINLGGQAVTGSQRKVGSNPANGRGDPSTKNPVVGAPLAPGTVGNFVGWIHGENVQGNDTWFKGTSDRWFWSGGFTDAGTHDLADLNSAPAVVGSSERQVGPNGANGRNAASTGGPVTQTLAPGSVWNFKGWLHGENVQGNDVWFQGANSGDWFWSGGFTDTGTHDLPDLNAPVTPPVIPPIDTSQTRMVGSNPVNLRPQPYATTAVITALPAGSVVKVDAFANAGSVSGNYVWFRRVDTNDWCWSGGFTSQAVDGLTQVEPPQPPTTPNVLDPAAPWKSQPVDSPLATWVGSPNYDYRASVMPKTHITLHWMTSTLAATDAQFQNPGTVIVNGLGTGSSSNYGVSANAIHQYVKEDRYVQSDGNAESNASTISVEHEGGWLLSDGTRQTPSKGVLDNAAKLLADIAKRQGWTELVWMGNVFPHKHFVATECPGTLDYTYELAEANRILRGTTPPVDPQVENYIVPKALGDQIRNLINQAFPGS